MESQYETLAGEEKLAKYDEIKTYYDESQPYFEEFFNYMMMITWFSFVSLFFGL